MILPCKELLFNPLRLAGLIAWFYLCLYILQRYEGSSLVPNRNKSISNLLLLLTGPLYLFVLLMISVVKRAEQESVSFFEALRMTFSKSLIHRIKRRHFSGARGEYAIVLLDSSGRSLSEVYGRSRDDRRHTEILELTEEIIGDAVLLSASDILIDPINSTTGTVRFRIDGMLRTTYEFDLGMCTSIVNSIKAISGMDIAEKRRPQDGAFIAKMVEGSISFRVASAGVLHGEKLSIRILNQISGPMDIKELGFSESQHKTIHEMTYRSSGMVLVCGPTGSGKSTTMYAILRCLDFNTKNVITIEDPIEYVLPQASQIEINTKANITFANTLRSVLRQDPDVICVGEIRDDETAAMALQASQTGHLVFATLHSSSNATALVRLLDLGVKPLLVSSALDLIISQRLVRKLCNHCKVAANLNDSQIINLKDRHIDPNTIMSPKGCKKCGGTGYSGRTGIFDLMVMNDEIKSQLMDGRMSVGELKKNGDGQFRKILQKQGMKLALEGTASLKEVKRVVSSLG
ncbi:MAG: type II/IV secretion system protein [Sedimentisphaerales bacterium]|nr:type II/IV secretion system protein [Sedimentisphaerales bacterium]